MGDETLYEVASNEYRSGRIDRELMSKAKALCGGDEQLFQSKYVILRVEQLKAERKTALTSAAIEGGRIAAPALAKLILAPILLVALVLFIVELML